MASLALPHWTFSLGVHSAAALLALAFARNVHVDVAPAPLSASIEVEYPPEAPPPAPPPPPPPQPSAPPVPVVQPAARARVLRRDTAPPTPAQSPSGTFDPGPPAPVDPPVNPAPTPPTPPVPRVTAANILRQSDNLINAMAAAAPAPTHNANVGRGSARDIFAPSDHGTIADIASAPTREAMAATQHTQPAGTMRYDRELARRAEEMFMPVRTIPGLGHAVSSAPTEGLSAVNHELSSGEVAVAGALDATHAQAYTTMAMGTMPPPRYHVVRAEVEVIQGANGAVRSASVVRRSGVHGFDEQALLAIREAVPEVDATTVRAQRRTRWAFEVSNSQSAASQLIGGGNDGWTVLREQSDGVWLRMRVRRLSVTLLPDG